MQSESVNELFTGIVKFQSAMKNPSKNRTVKVKTKTGGQYEFKYATFDQILDTIREPMADAGLGFMQEVETGERGLILTTTILHESGQWKSSTSNIPLGEDRTPQTIGSAISYFKRYTLTAALGIAADEDDDANSAQGNQMEVVGNPKPPVQREKPQAVSPRDRAKAWIDGRVDAVVKAKSATEIQDINQAIKTDPDAKTKMDWIIDNQPDWNETFELTMQECLEKFAEAEMDKVSA